MCTARTLKTKWGLCSRTNVVIFLFVQINDMSLVEMFYYNNKNDLIISPHISQQHNYDNYSVFLLFLCNSVRNKIKK